MRPCQSLCPARKSAIERQKTGRAGTARKMHGVRKINSQCRPFKRVCHLQRIFQSHTRQSGESFQRLIYLDCRKSVQTLQHPGAFNKDSLGNPHQPGRQKRSCTRRLRPIISRQETQYDVSICPDHAASSFPSQSPCPSPIHSCACHCISDTPRRRLWLSSEKAGEFSKKPLRPSPPLPIRFRSPIFLNPAGTSAIPPALWTIFLLFSSPALAKSKTIVRHTDYYTSCPITGATLFAILRFMSLHLCHRPPLSRMSRTSLFTAPP